MKHVYSSFTNDKNTSEAEHLKTINHLRSRFSREQFKKTKDEKSLLKDLAKNLDRKPIGEVIYSTEYGPDIPKQRNKK